MAFQGRAGRVVLATVLGVVALAGAAPGGASDFKTSTSSVLDTADAALTARGEVQQRAQLQTSRELLDLLAYPWPGALTKAVALAKAGSAAQARTTALDASAASTTELHVSPAQAAVALASLYDLDVDAGQLARLDQIAGPERDALARLIDAFASMRTAARVAFTSGDADAVHDLAGVFAARGRMLDAVVALREAMGPVLSATGPCSPITVPPAFSIDLDTCDNTYTEDIALLVDAAGNDTFFNNAGGSNGFNDGAGALIDLSGDDRYGDPAAPRSHGVNGGGYLGVGFLLDAEGSDIYTAGGHGTNGGSHNGSGFLVDVAGSDTYTAGDTGTNGGSCNGNGFLLDVAGNETYTAGWECTNGGGAFLVDVAGNDTYTAGSYGTNGGGFSGLNGFLLDAAGNDTYIAGSGGTNGGGYIVDPYRGTGFLLDAAGNDTYTAGRYGTNGGGYGGAGVLLDASGDDAYTAHLSYTADLYGTNGGANRGTGFLLDAEGSDTYLDLVSGAGADCTVVPKGTFFGAQIDLPNTTC